MSTKRKIMKINQIDRCEAYAERRLGRSKTVAAAELYTSHYNMPRPGVEVTAYRDFK